MDTGIDVLVEAMVPAPHIFASLRLLFARQEEIFSRFLPGSALSRLNRGESIDLPEFMQACRLAIEASEFTRGRFNPMVLPALTEAGYSQTFSRLAGGTPRRQPIPSPAQCLAFGRHGVRLVRGQLDLGGVVKGWTVDLAVEQFGGAVDGLFVNAGGDLRCCGSEQGHDGWLAAVEDEHRAVAWEGDLRGALATSTTRKRRWRTTAGTEAHHLIDPATGLPADSPFVQVSAWAPQTWRAEVWAKAVLIGGLDGATEAAAAGVRGLAVGPDGSKRWFG